MNYKLEIPPVIGGPIRKNGKQMKSFGNCNSTYSLCMGKSGSLNTSFDHTDESVKEREQFEKELQLNQGQLKANSSWWDLFKIDVPDQGLSLDDNQPLDRLRIKILKADKGIANSKIEYAKAPHKYIYILLSEQIEASTQNKRRDLIGTAYGIFNTLSENDMKDALSLYGKSLTILQNMVPDTIKKELGDKMEENPAVFINLLNDEIYKSKATVIRYVNAGVLQKGSAKPTFDQELLYEGNSLGLTLEQVARFILDKKNSKIKQAIETQYKTVK